MRIETDKKMWYSHEIEYYSAPKKELLTCAYVDELCDRVAAATLSLITRLKRGGKETKNAATGMCIWKAFILTLHSFGWPLSSHLPSNWASAIPHTLVLS